MRKVPLLLIFMVLLIAVFIGSQSLGDSSGLSCRWEYTPLTTYTGIGIDHTNNVEVRLTNANGSIVMPARRETGTTFTTLIYNQNTVSPGNYTATVIANGRQIETNTIILTNSSSPRITIICR